MEKLLVDLAKILIPGLVIAVLSSYVTVRLSLNRFYKEKWWEKKYSVYLSIFESLHHFKRYASTYLDFYTDDKVFEEGQEAKLNAELKESKAEFEKLLDLANFQLSEKAVSILQQYLKEKAEASRQDCTVDWIQADLDAAAECLDQLSAEAKIDLSIK